MLGSIVLSVILLGVYAFMVFSVPAEFDLGNQGSRIDALDNELLRDGASSVNCGHVGARRDPVPSTDCALTAFRAKKPFHVRYELQGIDSDVAIGWRGTWDGSVTKFDFDGAPIGGGGTSEKWQQVSERNCPKPVRLSRANDGRLRCD